MDYEVINPAKLRRIAVVNMNFATQIWFRYGVVRRAAWQLWVHKLRVAISWIIYKFIRRDEDDDTGSHYVVFDGRHFVYGGLLMFRLWQVIDAGIIL